MERRLPTQEEILRDIAHLDRAATMEIPFDHIFDMAKEDIDPELIGSAVVFESKEDRYLHGLIVASMPSIPDGNVEENAHKFIKRFGINRDIMAKNFKNEGTVEAFDDAVIIENLNLASASDFASYYDAHQQANLLTTREGGAKYELAEKYVDYWSFMDKVTQRAFEIERS